MQRQCSSSKSSSLTKNGQYDDILAPRRNECSNFMWTSRQLSPVVGYKQHPVPTPESHKEAVRTSAKVQELLATLSQQLNVPQSSLDRQVRTILDEIGYKKSLKVLRWLALVLVKICMRINKSIYMNVDNIVYLKSVVGSCPVMFVPSHRSYADFILMSFACFTQDIVIPAIAAGMDFHGMWGMGTMLRYTGAFFMRRSYNDDNLYWTIFKQYVYQLVTKGELPIEFFIEGTRSRSGKSLTPKYGLMAMILKAFFLSKVPDILFVPINITYNRVLEEKLFAFELLGIPKPKESTSGFFKSLSLIQEKYGNIYIDFAKPISAREFFGDKFQQDRITDYNPNLFGSIDNRELTDYERNLIPSLAHEIVHTQQKHCVITPFNLIAIVLDNNVTGGRDLLRISDLLVEVKWLKSVLEAFGACVDMTNPEIDIIDDLLVHRNVVATNRDGKITLVWNDIVLSKDSTTVLKGHGLKVDTINFSMPFILLQLYINPILHYLVDAAVLVIVLKYFKRSLSRDELYGNYHFLRSLLDQEFVTFPAREHMEFETALNTSLQLDLIRMTNDQQLVDLGDNTKLVQIIGTILDCFIYTYFVVCNVLLLETASRSVCDEKAILAKVQAQIEVGIDDPTIFVHPYCLSLDTITNCLNSLCLRNIISRTRRDKIVQYEINQGKVFDIKTKLENYISAAQVQQRKLDSVQLHLKNKL